MKNAEESIKKIIVPSIEITRLFGSDDFSGKYGGSIISKANSSFEFDVAIACSSDDIEEIRTDLTASDCSVLSKSL